LAALLDAHGLYGRIQNRAVKSPFGVSGTGADLGTDQIDVPALGIESFQSVQHLGFL